MSTIEAIPVCDVCGQPHMTEYDRDRTHAGGNITAYNVRKAEEAYKHWKHEQVQKAKPPEYVI